MLFWKPHWRPIFVWWQELKVYFRCAPFSSPGNQVWQLFCGVCCYDGGRVLPGEGDFFFPLCPPPLFFLSETLWEFLSSEAHLWCVMCSSFNLCLCLEVLLNKCIFFLQHTHHFMWSMNDTLKQRWWGFPPCLVPSLMCTFVHICTHVCQDGCCCWN